MKEEYDFRGGRRGAVVEVPSGKTRITIRLDDDVLEFFRGEVERQGGGSYQALINQALREFMTSERESLEKTLRRVVREELARRRRRATTDPIASSAISAKLAVDGSGMATGLLSIRTPIGVVTKR